MTNRNTLGRFPKQYLPYYDTNSDYNTNAGSYYDYLARLNYTIQLLIDRLNEFDYAKLQLEDTLSIELIKEIIESEDLDMDRLVKVSSNLRVADITKEVEIIGKLYNITNGIEIGKSGVFVPDYKEVLKDLDLKIESMDNSIPCKLESISPYIEVTKKGENHFQLSTEVLEAEIEEIKKKLEEGGGGGDDDFLGEFNEYDFIPVTGNKEVLHIKASSTDGILTLAGNITEGIGVVKYDIPRGNHNYSTWDIESFNPAMEMGGPQKKNLIIQFINSKDTAHGIRFLDGNRQYLTVPRHENDIEYKTGDIKIEADSTTTIKLTVYTDPDGKPIRSYIKDITEKANE